MQNILLVRRLVDRILAQDIGSALEWIADDVELTVLPAEPGSANSERLRGRQGVRDYFDALGGIVGFWRVRLVPEVDQVLVLGSESYTTDTGLEAESEFMLVFHARDGVIHRIVVVEDLAQEQSLQPTVFREAAELEAALV